MNIIDSRHVEKPLKKRAYRILRSASHQLALEFQHEGKTRNLENLKIIMATKSDTLLELSKVVISTGRRFDKFKRWYVKSTIHRDLEKLLDPNFTYEQSFLDLEIPKSMDKEAKRQGIIL